VLLFGALRRDDIRSPPDPRGASIGFKSALWGIFALAAALVIGLLASFNFELGMASAIGLVVVASSFSLPTFATPVFCFVLYSNLAVIAVKFHGVPLMVGALYPTILILPIAHYLIQRRERLVLDPTLALMLIYLAVLIAGALFSRSVRTAMATVQEFVLEGVVLYLLVTNVLRDSATFRSVMRSLVLAGLLIAAVPCIQQLTGTLDNNYGGLGQVAQDEGFSTGRTTDTGVAITQRRLAGVIGEKNRFAQVLLMLLPLLFYRFLGDPSRKWRWLALFASGLLMFALVLAFSRGAAVSFVVLLLSMMWLRVLRIRHLAVLSILAALILVLMPGYLKRLGTIAKVASLVTAEGNAQVDGGMKGRLTEMLAAVYVFGDHPVIGVGPGMFKHYSQEYGNRLGLRHLEIARQAHSLYLELAAENGILGLLSFGSIVLITLLQLNRARKRSASRDPEMSTIATSLMLGVIAYLASGLFLHMSYVRYFWFLIALCSAAVRIARTAPSPIQATPSLVPTLSTTPLALPSS